LIASIVMTSIAFLLSVTPVYSATIEFWTTETQSDRMKTIQLLMDTFQALNSDIAVIQILQLNSFRWMKMTCPPKWLRPRPQVIYLL
jgi:hypothetical protein